MPRDSARVAETRDWLAKAAQDLRTAEFELTARPPFTADIVFHAQQLAEKSLKAFLVWHDQPFRKTHNLVEIGEQCAAVDATLSMLLQRGAVLSDYAWRHRYPGEPDDPNETESLAALALAREVFNAILSRLPESVRA